MTKRQTSPSKKSARPVVEPREAMQGAVRLWTERISRGGHASQKELEAQSQRLIDTYLPALDPNDPKTRKRNRILRAAADHFVRSGYRKTSMDDVARDAHVAKGTLYLYFPNKAELLMAALSDEKARQIPRLMGMMKQELSGPEFLRQWLLSSLLALQEMPLTLRMMSGDREIMLAFEELNREMRTDILSLQKEAVVSFLATAGKGRWSAPELEDAAQVVMALFYAAGPLFEPKSRGEVPVERFAAALVNMIVDGIVGGTRGKGAVR
ncbi:MAG: TetR/AcrR family transcriptional regulator [Myxococcota bacterium]